MRITVKNLVVLGVMALLCMGCGRKLPPMPPGMPDPVEIISSGFDGDGVTIKAMCSVQGGMIRLLGKAKGICPACTDDLNEKDTKSIDSPGVVVLRDVSPESPYMVYRVAYKKDSTVWMTPVTVVVK